MSSFMSGMLAILAPAFVAALLASVWDSDLVVGMSTTSAAFIACATGLGGSFACSRAGSIMVVTVFKPIDAAAYENASAILSLFVSVTIRTVSSG